MGYGEWRFGVGEHGRDEQTSKSEIWRLLARSRRKVPEVVNQLVAVKPACSAGVSRQTSQTQFKPPPASKAWSRMTKLG